MPSKKTSIVDSLGRTRKVKYKYRYQSLLPGKAFYIAANLPKVQKSVRVLVARWNRRNSDVFLAARLTKTGRLQVFRHR